MIKRSIFRNALYSLVFALVLVSLSEVIVQVSGLPRLSVIIVVFIVGFAGSTVLERLHDQRTAAKGDGERPPASWHP